MTSRRLLAAIGLWASVVALGPARADGPKPIDLGAVEGSDKFPGTDADREVLRRNGFVVLPRLHEQIFSPYIGGSLPYYVTCDSAHHTWQVLFETALKDAERAFRETARRMVGRLHERLLAVDPSTPRLREGRALALGWAAVARRLLGETAGVPADLEARVAKEIALAGAAEGIATSPLFGVPEDYALYRPRGFYAGDPDLESYFRAVRWLGRRGFRVSDERETAAALLVAREFARDDALRADWAAMDGFLRSMVGAPDDLGPDEYETVLRAVGGDPSDSAIENGFQGLRESLAALRDPRINADLLQPNEWLEFRRLTKGLRLLPSRFTPDAALFQTLNEQDPDRPLPSALEVALALGSHRAGEHLATSGDAGRRRAEAIRSASAGFMRDLSGTQYGATLEGIGTLFDGATPLLGGGTAPDGASGTPVFPAPLFRTPAWHDRLLTTGISAWTGLRHAWVLHAKTVEFCLCETQDPAGVVEPAPAYYASLAQAARGLVAVVTRTGAGRRDGKAVLAALLPILEKEAPTAEDMERLMAESAALDRFPSDEGDPASAKVVVRRLRAWLDGKGELDAREKAWVESLGASDTQAYLDSFAELADRLRAIAEKELRGEAISDEDEAFIQEYGKTIAGLNFFGGNSYYSPGKQMGFVVDVAADPRRGVRRLEAVGAAMELYVVLPLRGGGQRLYQGGVYSHYEFEGPQPLTDDEWRARVSGRDTPALSPWTQSYVSAPDLDAVVARIAKGEEVAEVASLRDVRIGRALLAQLAAMPDRAAYDHRVYWTVEQAGAYLDGPLRAEAWAAVYRRLLVTPDWNVGYLASQLLLRSLTVEDLATLVSALRAPPEGSSPEVRRRLVDLLLDVHRSAATRERLHADVPGLLLGLLSKDESPDTRAAVLEGLTEIAPEVGRAHATKVVPLLASTDPGERAVAATLLGRIGGPEHADSLYPLLGDAEPDVVAAAAEALGTALSEAKDPAAITRVVETLETTCRRGPWAVSVGCVNGLGALRRPESAAALGRIAGSSEFQPLLRSIAARELGESGEVAVPALLRLCFDETPTGNSVNSHAERVCDVAVLFLVRRLDGGLGCQGTEQGQLTDEAELSRRLDEARAEARRLGIAK